MPQDPASSQWIWPPWEADGDDIKFYCDRANDLLAPNMDPRWMGIYGDARTLFALCAVVIKAKMKTHSRAHKTQ
jgi:hypothetical protein